MITKNRKSFIREIKEKLKTANDQLKYKGTPNQRARKIIETIPIRIIAWLKNPSYPYPPRMTIYCYFKNELGSKEFRSNQHSMDKSWFQKGTVGYYLCEYLSELGVPYGYHGHEIYIIADYMKDLVSI